MRTSDPQSAIDPAAEPPEDPTEVLDLVFRNLRSSAGGLNGREAARRLLVDGPNQLTRRGKPQWPRELLGQFTQPLALLLIVAAVLAAVSGSVPLSIAIAAVIILNAVFAFFQEQHAEHAVETLAAYLPAEARVLRDGSAQAVAADSLVPGDVLLIEEGDRISADARTISGSVEVDLSTSPVNPNPSPAHRVVATPAFRFSSPRTCFLAAAHASLARLERSAPPPVCTPRSDVSPRCRSGSAAAKPARWKGRSRRSQS
jgi:hypothetical protein